METKSNFPLEEIVTVAVALGFFLILAAILIPQFTEAGTESDRGGGLGHNLIVMRPQIELYKIQLNQDLPGTAASVNFEQALTQRTNPDGSINPAGPCGPYTLKIPVNCYNGLDTIEIDGVLGGSNHGWHYNTITGEFHADTDKHAGL